jgi:hypothetical protein
MNEKSPLYSFKSLSFVTERDMPIGLCVQFLDFENNYFKDGRSR